MKCRECNLKYRIQFIIPKNSVTFFLKSSEKSTQLQSFKWNLFICCEPLFVLISLRKLKIEMISESGFPHVVFSFFLKTFTVHRTAKDQFEVFITDPDENLKENRYSVYYRDLEYKSLSWVVELEYSFEVRANFHLKTWETLFWFSRLRNFRAPYQFL